MHLRFELATAALLAIFSTSSAAVSTGNHFATCPPGHAAAISGSDVAAIVLVRSEIECATRCSQQKVLPSCSAFNACKVNSTSADNRGEWKDILKHF
jgi:hypothetical protein